MLGGLLLAGKRSSSPEKETKHSLTIPGFPDNSNSALHQHQPQPQQQQESLFGGHEDLISSAAAVAAAAAAASTYTAAAFQLGPSDYAYANVENNRNALS